MKRYLLFIVMAAVATTFSAQVVHPRIGTTVRSDDGRVALTLIGKKIAYSSADPDTYDPDIHSPKSVNVHPSGKKFYVNSLEGCATVVYDRDAVPLFCEELRKGKTDLSGARQDDIHRST